jgi:hypothetical protein
LRGAKVKSFSFLVVPLRISLLLSEHVIFDAVNVREKIRAIQWYALGAGILRIGGVVGSGGLGYNAKGYSEACAEAATLSSSL